MNKWHTNNVLNKVRKDINCIVEDILLYKDYSKTYDSINYTINKLIKLKEYMEEHDKNKECTISNEKICY